MIQSSKCGKDDEDSGIDENKMSPAVDAEDIDNTKNYFETCRLCDLACPVGS